MQIKPLFDKHFRIIQAMLNGCQLLQSTSLGKDDCELINIGNGRPIIIKNKTINTMLFNSLIEKKEIQNDLKFDDDSKAKWYEFQVTEKGKAILSQWDFNSPTDTHNLSLIKYPKLDEQKNIVSVYMSRENYCILKTAMELMGRKKISSFMVDSAVEKCREGSFTGFENFIFKTSGNYYHSSIYINEDNYEYLSEVINKTSFRSIPRLIIFQALKKAREIIDNAEK